MMARMESAAWFDLVLVAGIAVVGWRHAHPTRAELTRSGEKFARRHQAYVEGQLVVQLDRAEVASRRATALAVCGGYAVMILLSTVAYVSPLALLSGILGISTVLAALTHLGGA